ncbi:uncharacterized protein LOC115056224 [Echeneis naucrates]|uniref:uncharacterized protein LOC115056224 n=1 Tax=Echeneis naucrates TaxID=173247 RepID=UPI001113B68A|nr:uncharacterized protein LOC115056224 [Echeneis naucrates]
MFGACCLRKPRQGRPMTQQRYTQHGHSMCSEDRTASGYELPNLEHDTSYSNIDFNYTEPEDLSGNHKRINCCNHLSFTYTCDYVTLKQCQALVKNQAGETQAVSFAPGVKCSVMRSGGGCGCLSQHELWNFGERVSQGREVCTYTGRGRDNCACGHLIQRKEIRDLTLREMRVYQRAIRKLYARSALWKGFALLRAEFSPQAGDAAFFLPWHRYFLQLVESELQSVSSCKVAIPYFEWTVDSGSMKSSAAWQAGFFGGDGEPDLGCIPHHPFQGSTSHSHWSPCLRRRFNSSVWLPNAVNLQRTLNQGDFRLFSQSLQIFSGLFRLWVGGDMASPLAAYDPLYLSHMAFMDKLWVQWQEKHQHALKRQTYSDDPAQSFQYPATQRHLKMDPFDATPNDVISSQQQMCVVYVPITIGAPCNMTKLQKHPQRSWKFKKSNIAKDKHSQYRYFVSGAFESSGFDKHGYDRDGYDRSGWDRYGFGKDGFNRDFVDRDGYDVSGFNRYGFNRSNVTMFGMHRDGLFVKEKTNERNGQESEDGETQEKEKFMSELFGDKGYSVFGFDPFGLDYGGFDAFGFQTDGYDKDRCNWFFDGPHYMRFYFHTQQHLMSLSDQALNRITRTCPPITSLPTHWAMLDWMDFEPELGWLRQNKPQNENTIVAAKQTESKIWLPITPDHRFCFELHWFSGCPLGSAPISCPDLCYQARCHGYPEAVCHIHNCGSCFTEWRDPETGNHVICHDW